VEWKSTSKQEPRQEHGVRRSSLGGEETAWDADGASEGVETGVSLVWPVVGGAETGGAAGDALGGDLEGDIDGGEADFAGGEVEVGDSAGGALEVGGALGAATGASGVLWEALGLLISAYGVLWEALGLAIGTSGVLSDALGLAPGAAEVSGLSTAANSKLTMPVSVAKARCPIRAPSWALQQVAWMHNHTRMTEHSLSLHPIFDGPAATK